MCYPPVGRGMEAHAMPQAHLVGREQELAAVHDLLVASGRSRALVVTGEPGIGKTTLWEAGIGEARERGFRVLSTRASSADARLAFAALIDLLDEVGGEELEALPAPQRQALEVAVLRVEPVGHPPDERAIALGLLNVLRGPADGRSALIAIDDLQWLDSPSLKVLMFVAPRLETPGFRFLLSRRPGRFSPLERAIGPPLDRLAVGPLSLGATRQLLHDRLGLDLPRPLLRRLVDATMGNPPFELEVGRMLTETDLPGIGDDLPLPDTVEDLLGTRVGRLPGRVRRLLLTVALSQDPTVAQLETIADSATVDEAVEANVLIVDGNRVRAAHPLLAAAAKKRARAAERRELHFELSRVVVGEELRARHLALASDAPDVELAATIAAAARTALSRGAWQAAGELGEQALRLTPADDPTRPERAFYVVWTLATIGERERAAGVLTAELESAPAGPDRARLWLMMPVAVDNNDELLGYFERALEEGD